MTDMADIDVLVAGLGPAGASAAEEAARRGMKVLAVDRKSRAGFPVQCAEFVPRLIGMEVEALQRVMLQGIGAMRTFVENDAFHESDDFRGVMIDRERFDAGRVDAASLAGADCQFGVSVREVSHDGSVQLSDGRRIRPAALIGADGPGSRVGRAIGSVNDEIAETRQVQVALREPFAATDIFLSAAIPGGYAWLFPKGGVANLGLGVAPPWRGRLKPLLCALHQRLADEARVGRDILGTTGGAIPVGGLRHPIGRLGTTDVYLAGDAAGLTNPVTGAGIAAAVLSGRLAGEYAARSVSGNADAPEDYLGEIVAVFGRSLQRAVNRRRCLLAIHENGRTPGPADLEAGWIAFPGYWATREERAGP